MVPDGKLLIGHFAPKFQYPCGCEVVLVAGSMMRIVDMVCFNTREGASWFQDKTYLDRR